MTMASVTMRFLNRMKKTVTTILQNPIQTHLLPEVGDHRSNGQQEPQTLEGVESVAIEHKRQHQRQDLAEQTNQSTVQRTKLIDCNEDKHLQETEIKTEK